MEKLVNKKQLSLLHTLLNLCGLKEEKSHLVATVTKGRTTSSRELYYSETVTLINSLKSLLDAKGRNPLDSMRRKVFALAYGAGIIYGDTPEDKKMNAIKLNQFIFARGVVKKQLSEMTKGELLKTINQFTAIVKHVEQTKSNKVAKTLLNDLLNELNLDVK